MLFRSSAINTLDDRWNYFRGIRAVNMFLQEVEGQEFDELKHNEKVISYSSRYLPGDSVEFTNTTRQRLAEIDILGENYLDLASAIKKIQESINVADMDGNNMMYCPFDIKRMPND